MNSILVWLLLVFFLSGNESYKILVAFPFPSKSHNILGTGVVKRLLMAGHEVTFITPFPVSNPHPLLKQIDVSNNTFSGDVVNIQSIMSGQTAINDEVDMFDITLDVAKQTFQHSHVQEFLSDPKQQFDAVVAEWMFNELYAGLGPVFNCPFIWSLSYEPYVISLRLVDEAPNPAYVANLGSSNSPPFSFTQRVSELWSQLRSVYLKDFRFYYSEKEAYETSFTTAAAKRGQKLPHFDDVRFNASLILSSSHVSLGGALRLPQSIKLIGGYYIDDNVQPLPEDLQKVMDNAEHGVIYFSMGSNLKSKDLPDSIKNGLINMFGKRKETVVWKFEENFTNLPKNIYIVQWAPQQSILAHRNCKLFITHGGLLSTTETVHFGVPIIGIPVYVDQFNNVDNAVAKGYAKRVDLSYALAQDLGTAIDDILKNPKYKNRAKQLSLIYHDRPMTPGNELVHWVEHVVKTQGALHLRSPALLVPWYQKMYIDLVAVILIVLILIRKILKLLFSRNVVKRSKKDN